MAFTFVVTQSSDYERSFRAGDGIIQGNQNGRFTSSTVTLSVKITARNIYYNSSTAHYRVGWGGQSQEGTFTVPSNGTASKTVTINASSSYANSYISQLEVNGGGIQGSTFICTFSATITCNIAQYDKLLASDMNTLDKICGGSGNAVSSGAAVKQTITFGPGRRYFGRDAGTTIVYSDLQGRLFVPNTISI